MNLTQSEMKRLSDLAWKDQMDAKVRHEDASFRRTGRSVLFLLTTFAAVWPVVALSVRI